MIPVPFIALGVAGAGYLAVKKLTTKTTAAGTVSPQLPSAAAQYQGQIVQGPGGVPVKVMTPIASHVTVNQQKGISTPPAPSPAPSKPAPAVAQTVPGQGVVYAPPKMVTVSGPGLVQLAPIIITPTGASSVAIGSVLDIQKALNTLGYKPALKEDGKFGPATAANIRAFQSKTGLVVDGNAGPATKAGLSNTLAGFTAAGPAQAPIAAAATAAVAASAPNNINTLKDIQQALNSLGATPPLVVDGKSGPKTVAAIKSFQLSHGIVVDGVAGPKTKQAISLAAIPRRGG